MTGTSSDSEQLAKFGYKQDLDREMGLFSSFGIAFSAVSITGTIVLTLPYVLGTSGTWSIWTVIGSFVGGMAVALVFADMVGRIPLAGYGYQWASRLSSADLGWFVAVGGILAFFLGTALGFYGFSPFFLAELGISVTKGSQVLCGVVLLVIVVTVNAVGIKLTARLNNVAVVTELVAGVGVAIALLITAIVKHPHPASFLFQEQPGHTGSYLSAGLQGFFLGAFLFVAWEASADLAEETKNAPRVAARAMLWTIVVVFVGGLIMSVAYAYASRSIPATLGSSVPILSVIQYQWGNVAARIVDIGFLVSFFSVLMITTAAAARLVYSLARDNMLPGARVLRRVSVRHRSPIGAIAVVGLLMLIFTVLPPYVLSTSVIGYLLGASGFGYHAVYLLVLGVYIVKVYRRTLPEALPGAVLLGGWRMAIACFAFLYELFVLGVIALPAQNRDAAVTAIVLFAAAGLWYLVYLRPRTRRGEAGPAAMTPVAAAVSAEPPGDQAGA
jgi:amino acid transporter